MSYIDSLIVQEFSYGPVAQLGERLHGMEEVRGSNPLRSTKPISPGFVMDELMENQGGTTK